MNDMTSDRVVAIYVPGSYEKIGTIRVQHDGERETFTALIGTSLTGHRELGEFQTYSDARDAVLASSQAGEA